MNSRPCSHKFHRERNSSVSGEEYTVDVPTWTAKHTAGLKYHPVSGRALCSGCLQGLWWAAFLLVVCSCPCAAPRTRQRRLLWDRGHLCTGSTSSVWDCDALSFLTGLVHDPHPTLKESGFFYLAPSAPFISVECLFLPSPSKADAVTSRLSLPFPGASSLFLRCWGSNATPHYSCQCLSRSPACFQVPPLRKPKEGKLNSFSTLASFCVIL